MTIEIISDSICTNITIRDDDIMEDTEYFTVELGLSSGLIGEITTATVTIEDNDDGEYIYDYGTCIRIKGHHVAKPVLIQRSAGLSQKFSS